MDGLDGVISGMFGLIGNAINFGFNDALTSKQNTFNREMWDLQNKYNSPFYQMQRYEQAGLNPSLMYGQISSGNAPHADLQILVSAR